MLTASRRGRQAMGASAAALTRPAARPSAAAPRACQWTLSKSVFIKAFEEVHNSIWSPFGFLRSAACCMRHRGTSAVPQLCRGTAPPQRQLNYAATWTMQLEKCNLNLGRMRHSSSWAQLAESRRWCSRQPAGVAAMTPTCGSRWGRLSLLVPPPPLPCKLLSRSRAATSWASDIGTHWPIRMPVPGPPGPVPGPDAVPHGPWPYSEVANCEVALLRFCATVIMMAVLPWPSLD